MKIFHHAPKQKPKDRAVIRHYNRYYGWTGFEEFGVISPYRYFGWRVTCWARVESEAGLLRHAAFFAHLEDAVGILDRLMDLAKKMGELAHEPVRYWEPAKDCKPNIFDGNLEFISDMLLSDWRAPDSPAHRARLFKRFPSDRPLTKKQIQYRKWECSPVPSPELYL